MKYETSLFSELNDAQKLEVAKQVRQLVKLLNKRYEPDMPTPSTSEILSDELVNPSLVAHRAIDGDALAGITLVRDSKLDGGTYISDVFVPPKYRGRGVGEALVRRALDDAKARGRKSVLLGVFAKNMPARNLYDKLGFTTESLRMKKKL